MAGSRLKFLRVRFGYLKNRYKTERQQVESDHHQSAKKNPTTPENLQSGGDSEIGKSVGRKISHGLLLASGCESARRQ
jgi:hypothetical protein